MFYKAVKRTADFLSAVIIGIITLPIMLVAILIIHIKSPEASAVFKQTRVGYKEKNFTIYKLRTMTDDRDENGDPLPDEYRLKPWGKVIRKLSIDELPQVLNILKGEMSWIGPRPLLPQEMCVMTPEEQKERQSVLPGVTGWEAVNEEKSDSRREMAMFDLEYVRKFSLLFDMKILYKTVIIILGAKRAEDELRAPKIKEEEIVTKQR